jgi:transposase
VLSALVESLREELAQTRAELERARQKIAELEARLAQSPRNSSKPPSSEGLAKPPPRKRSLRKKSGRKPGGQEGHAGRTLTQAARPDRVRRHEPACCSRCGAGLAGGPLTSVERRQVFDLPPMKIEVTEHQLIERECGCGHRTKAAAPAGAEAPVQYGPRVAAIIIYLYIGQFLSKQRAAQALAELFGVPVSAGTVAAITGRAAGRLGSFLARAREQIAGSQVAGFDETGFRVEGKLAWVHCARTSKYTLLTVHPKRGRKAIEAMGVLPSFAGVAVHDAWSPYDGYAHADHQLCCAHVLRELQAVADGAPAGKWCWATQAAEAITAMERLVAEAISQGRQAVDPVALAGQVTRYRSAALIGASQARAREGKLMRKHHALARRLLDRQDDYLRFSQDFAIPADNERASYCTSWVRSAVSRFLRWSARCVASMAWGAGSSGQWAAEAGVVAAA